MRHRGNGFRNQQADRDFPAESGVSDAFLPARIRW
jgi:hypothetical protein